VVVTHLHHVEGPDGTRVRLAQLPRLLEQAAGRPGTVLLGDFNAEPESAEIALVRAAGLTDGFVAAGGGRADELTWPSDRLERRIDYLWLSPDLAASGSRPRTARPATIGAWPSPSARRRVRPGPRRQPRPPAHPRRGWRTGGAGRR
jgi:endonuclease/exonuclease/phosphatase family metal-dependent hydrolase